MVFAICLAGKVREETFASARFVTLNRPLFTDKVRDHGGCRRVEADYVHHAPVVRIGEGEAVGGHAHNDRLRVYPVELLAPKREGGFEPPTNSSDNPQSTARKKYRRIKNELGITCSTTELPRRLVPKAGLEPATTSLTDQLRPI
jgi:hypothetical protein